MDHGEIEPLPGGILPWPLQHNQGVSINAGLQAGASCINTCTGASLLRSVARCARTMGEKVLVVRTIVITLLR